MKTGTWTRVFQERRVGRKLDDWTTQHVTTAFLLEDYPTPTEQMLVVRHVASAVNSKLRDEDGEPARLEVGLSEIQTVSMHCYARQVIGIADLWCNGTGKGVAEQRLARHVADYEAAIRADPDVELERTLEQDAAAAAAAALGAPASDAGCG